MFHDFSCGEFSDKNFIFVSMSCDSCGGGDGCRDFPIIIMLQTMFDPPPNFSAVKAGIASGLLISRVICE